MPQFKIDKQKIYKPVTKRTKITIKKSRANNYVAQIRLSRTLTCGAYRSLDLKGRRLLTIHRPVVPGPTK